MLRTVPKSSKSTVPDERLTPSANSTTEKTVFISTHEVLLNTAAAVHHRPSVSGLLHAITHIHIHPHQPNPIYLRREASYFEAARMARHMTDL